MNEQHATTGAAAEQQETWQLAEQFRAERAQMFTQLRSAWASLALLVTPAVLALMVVLTLWVHLAPDPDRLTDWVVGAGPEQISAATLGLILVPVGALAAGAWASRNTLAVVLDGGRRPWRRALAGLLLAAVLALPLAPDPMLWTGLLVVAILAPSWFEDWLPGRPHTSTS